MGESEGRRFGKGPSGRGSALSGPRDKRGLGCSGKKRGSKSASGSVCIPDGPGLRHTHVTSPPPSPRTWHLALLSWGRLDIFTEAPGAGRREARIPVLLQ